MKCISKTDKCAATWLNGWIPVFVWMGVIFTLSHQSSLPQFVNAIQISDFIPHAIEYFILALLVMRALRDWNNFSTIALALLICGVFAVTDEWHQSFIEGRKCDIIDFVADMFGTAVAIVARQLYYMRRFQNGKRQRARTNV